MALTRINNQAMTNVTSDGIPALDSDKLPSGTVLQVKSTTHQIGMVTSSTGFVDSGLSLSITPTSTSSKILVIVNQSITPPTSGTNTYARGRVLRGTTEINADQRLLLNHRYGHTYYSVSELDSPSTTSSVTYKVQVGTGNGSYSVEAQHANLRPSTITLMEIAG